MLAPFKKEIDKISLINQEDWKSVEKILEIKSFSKNDFLLREEKKCNSSYFVISGAFRTYQL